MRFITSRLLAKTSILTRRNASAGEASARYRVTDDVRLRGGLAYTRATFREGAYAGNDIPLVSRWTGNAGASWDIVKKYLVLDVTAQFFGPRRMDNDQLNIQPLIPANATVDAKIGGEFDRYFWSVSVLNLFNVQYFDYAIASGGLPAEILDRQRPRPWARTMPIPWPVEPSCCAPARHFETSMVPAMAIAWAAALWH